MNNISLQEINRYQFRKGRPSKPGFPVQQAGSAGNNEVPSMVSPSSPKKLPVTGKPQAGSSYWLGPPKTSVQGGMQPIPRATQPQPTPKGGYRAGSQPILGPKKVDNSYEYEININLSKDTNYNEITNMYSKLLQYEPRKVISI